MNRPTAIRLGFSECGITARAFLLWEKSPFTCAAVVQLLPSIGTAHHAVYSGSECVLLLDTTLSLEAENATSNVTKGQVGFAFLAAGSSYGVDRDITEVCWFYDIDAQPRMWEGPVDVNIFAEIREPADDFYAMCRRMRREGVKPFRIEVDHA